MGNEIYHTYNEGNTLYALIWRASDDKVWNNTDSTFDTYTDADILKYDVPLTNQVDSDYYTVDFPAGITGTDPVSYRVQVMLQIGGSPHADDDYGIAHGEIVWDGSNEVTLGTLTITNQTVTNVYNDEPPSTTLTIIKL